MLKVETETWKSREKKEGLAEKRKGEEQAGISLNDKTVICQ